MALRLSPAERVLITAVLGDLMIGTPIVLLGLLSGSASATSEAIRVILLVSIDVFSVAILLAVNRQRFSQFEFGIEKIQILVQICIAIGMCLSIAFIANKIYDVVTVDNHLPDYVYCVGFALICYVNILVNVFNLRRMIAEERAVPSIILRAQIKNRIIMLTSSVVATISAGSVIIPDTKLFTLIDATGAVIVLSVIVYTMLRMMGSGLLTLLDAPIDEKDKLLVFREIVEHFDRWDGIAFIRTRRMGYSKYIEVGLSFDRSLDVDRVLASCQVIEAGITQRVANAFVTVFPADEESPPDAEEAAAVS